LKVGQHLPKLLTNIKWLTFFETIGWHLRSCCNNFSDRHGDQLRRHHTV